MKPGVFTQLCIQLVFAVKYRGIPGCSVEFGGLNKQY